MSDAEFAPESSSPTKITYIDGRPATITLRRCRLEVVRDDRIESRVFDGDVITVGATDDNDLVLGDDTVSRNHCRIYREGDSFVVKDLESTNGTFINRVRIKEAWLKQGCTLSLGKTDMRFAPVEEKVQIVPSDKQRFGDLIGRNARMREIYAILDKIAPTDATVVIEGETGTGKEVVARSLHQASLRKNGPFMIFDCGAVPENLIESELFGHEKGAFTGAVATRQGVFEMANGGTVFLDELGELALDLQPKLLRVLEQRELKRVGGSRSFKVDVRIVAATNRTLEEEVRQGRFRQDLYYRLSVVRLGLPPLRERKEDIPILVKHFLRNGKYNRNADGTPAGSGLRAFRPRPPARIRLAGKRAGAVERRRAGGELRRQRPHRAPGSAGPRGGQTVRWHAGERRHERGNEGPRDLHAAGRGRPFQARQRELGGELRA